MTDQQGLAERFEQHRNRLRVVAYRMLGSLTEADDAVQEAWLRLARADASGVENLGAWLTTIVARVSLNMLRARHSRPEEPLGPHVPEPVIDPAEGTSPEHEALLADGSGSRCWWCCKRSARPNGWRTCCTTCSTCRSMRSPRSSSARHRQPASSPAAPGAASMASRCLTAAIWLLSGRPLTRFWPPPAMATSAR